MRTRRVLAFVLLGVCLVEGLSSGVREFFVLFGMLLVMLLFSVVSAWLRSQRLSCTQRLSSDYMMAGESVDLEIHTRHSLIPALVKLTVRTPQEDRYAVLPAVSWKDSVQRYPIASERRGEFPVGAERADVYDLFGLFRFCVSLSGRDGKLPVLVTTPHAFYLPCRLTAGVSENGTVAATGSLSSEDSGIYSESRQYQLGDSLKRIHWKLSVRTGEMHTRLYEKSEASPAILLADSGVLPAEYPDADAVCDKLCECAATIGWNLLLQGHPFQLTDNDGDLTRCDGEGTFPAAMRRLAAFSFDSNSSCSELLSALPGRLGKSQIYLFTPRLTPALMDIILKVREHGSFITMIIVGQPPQHPAGNGSGLRFLTVGLQDDTAQALEAGL